MRSTHIQRIKITLHYSVNTNTTTPHMLTFKVLNKYSTTQHLYIITQYLKSQINIKQILTNTNTTVQHSHKSQYIWSEYKKKIQ